jgi:NAD(P)-dependent dehydrogenase (short-subunit alcohol dehydrogenase family)
LPIAARLGIRQLSTGLMCDFRPGTFKDQGLDMTSIANKVALVTGGNRGFGRAIAEALAASGATVLTLSRRPSESPDPRITEIIGDATDEALRDRVFDQHRPDILVLNAGLKPPMAAPHELSWEAFSSVWNNDLKHSFVWSQKAVSAPMPPGSTVLVVSSGAAIQGSPMSGGYAGAKRMQWLLSNYLRQLSDRLGLGLRFCALLPRALSADTEIGQAAAEVYARMRGTSREAYFASFGPPLTPAIVGSAALSILDGTAPEAAAYAVTGNGLEVFEKG